MESRLSEHVVRRHLDRGHLNLSWEGQDGFLAALDLKALMQREDAAAVIAELPSQQIFLALKKEGRESALVSEVMQHVTTEQLTRFLDYDCWSSGGLEKKAAYGWLAIYLEHGKEVFAHRFRDLDEELQLALLDQLIRVYTQEEMEALPESLQDQLRAMPCGTIFYEITSEDPETIAFVEALIEAATSSELLEYAYLLIAHAAHLPPGEQEAQLAQFRKARLEEDGFVSESDSQSLFVPASDAELSFWQEEVPAALRSQECEGQAFLDLVLDEAQSWDLEKQYELHLGFLYLANGISAAAGVEPGDVAGLTRILTQVKALLGMGLDVLSGHQPSVALGILQSAQPKLVWRLALNLICSLREDLARTLMSCPQLAAAGEKLRKSLRGSRYGVALRILDTEIQEVLGYEWTSRLKGICNRFPMLLVAKKDTLSFRPLLNAADFEVMSEQVASLAQLLRLLSEAQSLEAGLTVALANFASEGSLRVGPIATSALSKLSTLTKADWDDVRTRLKGQKSSAGQPFTKLSLEVLEDLLTGLQAASEHGHLKTLVTANA